MIETTNSPPRRTAPWSLALLAVGMCALCAGNSSKGDWEVKARARWFHFELPDAGGGKIDWRAFHAKKLKDEKAFAAKEKGLRPRGRMGPALNAEQARARRVLRWEFDRVAKPRVQEAAQLASRVLLDLRAIASPFPHRSKMWGPENQHYFQEELQTKKRAYEDIAKTYNEKKPLARPEFLPPSPNTGIPGRVRFSFGDPVPPPKGKGGGKWGPPRAQIELMWEGQVMPEPNRPPNAKPTPPHTEHPGEWVFYRIVFPYSRNYSVGLI